MSEAALRINNLQARKSRGEPGIHLLDLQTRQIHAVDNIGKQSNHIIIAHSHIGDNLFEGDFLGGVVLVLLAAAIKFLTQLGDLAL